MYGVVEQKSFDRPSTLELQGHEFFGVRCAQEGASNRPTWPHIFTLSMGWEM